MRAAWIQVISNGRHQSLSIFDNIEATNFSRLYFIVASYAPKKSNALKPLRYLVRSIYKLKKLVFVNPGIILQNNDRLFTDKAINPYLVMACKASNLASR